MNLKAHFDGIINAVESHPSGLFERRDIQHIVKSEVNEESLRLLLDVLARHISDEDTELLRLLRDARQFIASQEPMLRL